MTNSRMMVMVVSLERHMEEERKVIFEAVVGQNGIPVGLPFSSIPANYIYKLNSHCMADSDYILMLVGTQYGALSDQGVSNIHSMYAMAQASRKPIVSLVYNGPVPNKQDEFDKKRLDGFIKQLEFGLVFYWQDQDSLRDSAERALEHIFETFPASGWMKAEEQRPQDHDTADRKLIHQLKAQITHLTNRLKTPHFSHAESKLESDRKAWVIRYQCNAFREGRLKQVDGQVSLLLKDAFDYLSPTLLAPVTEARIQATLSSKLHRMVLADVKSTWDGSHAVSDIKVGQNSIDELKMRFRAYNLIDFDHQGRWQLTQHGEVLALKIHT